MLAKNDSVTASLSRTRGGPTVDQSSSWTVVARDWGSAGPAGMEQRLGVDQASTAGRSSMRRRPGAQPSRSSTQMCSLLRSRRSGGRSPARGSRARQGSPSGDREAARPCLARGPLADFVATLTGAPLPEDGRRRGGSASTNLTVRTPTLSGGAPAPQRIRGSYPPQACTTEANKDHAHDRNSSRPRPVDHPRTVTGAISRSRSSSSRSYWRRGPSPRRVQCRSARFAVIPLPSAGP